MLVTSYIQTEFDKELLKRDSNGCVECPSSAGSCPSCPSGQQCELSSQTCNSCQEYYCATIVSKKLHLLEVLLEELLEVWHLLH